MSVKVRFPKPLRRLAKTITSFIKPCAAFDLVANDDIVTGASRLGGLADLPPDFV